MRLVALFGHGPNWQYGKTVYEQPAIHGHLESMRRRFDEGRLLLGGPFEDGGGLAVLEATDEGAGRLVLDGDPAVAAGVLTYRLHRLHAYFDAIASVRTDLSVEDLAQRRAVG